MEHIQFSEEQLDVVQSALDIAEEITGDFYKISQSEWRKTRYEVKTLRSLNEFEITDSAFAQVFKYSRSPDTPPRPQRVLDYYLICLQDHKILAALEREEELSLLNLCVYILTHELVHVVRFARLFKNFDCTSQERIEEETEVHEVTYRILSKLNTAGMDFVLRSFMQFRDVDRLVT